MALPKKQLRAKLMENGITDETALSELMTWIMDANSASLDGLREQLDEANTKLTALQNAKVDLERVQGELDTLKNTTSDAANIRQEFDNYKAAVEEEKLNATKTRLVRQALIDDKANPKAVDLMMRGIDLSAVEVEGDGDAAALKDRTAVVKPYHDSFADWFGTDTTAGVPPINPPSGGENIVTKDSIMKIKDTVERRAAIAEHPALFGLK